MEEVNQNKFKKVVKTNSEYFYSSIKIDIPQPLGATFLDDQVYVRRKKSEIKSREKKKSSPPSSTHFPMKKKKNRKKMKKKKKKKHKEKALLAYLLVLLLEGELLLLDLLELVAEVELGRLLLQLGELVFVLGDLLQGWLHAASPPRTEERHEREQLSLGGGLFFRKAGRIFLLIKARS